MRVLVLPDTRRAGSVIMSKLLSLPELLRPSIEARLGAMDLRRSGFFLGVTTLDRRPTAGELAALTRRLDASLAASDLAHQK